jgi:site-specific recombinase XerD
MEKDYRMDFIRNVESALARTYDPDEIVQISNIVIKALSEYEIAERCTDLVPQDDINEKLIRRYTACLLVDGKSKNTVKQYARTAQKLSDLIRKPFTEMGTYDVRYFLATEKERGLSNSTLETQRSYLSAFFQWLTDDEVIQRNPIGKLKPIKYKQEIRKAFSDVELDALRSACRTPTERALIEMLLSTGVRVSELTSMKVEDVNMSDLSVHVVHGKGAKERMTYMTPVAAKHLLAYLHSRKEDSDVLFCNMYHERLRSGGVNRILNTIGKRAGVENVHPHRFRRTFATNLARRGMEIQEIQKLLGHSNINTTMIYVSTDDTKVRASYSRYTA